jgi:hypothetical protein
MEREEALTVAPLSVATEEILAIIGTIGKRGRALWPIALLVARLGDVDRDAVLDAAAELEHEGRICTWAEAKGGPAITLSPLEAERQGLELDDTSRKWRRRVPGGRKRPIRIKRQIVEVAEIEDWRPWLPEDGPLPTILMGERLMWNGPEQMHERKYQVLTKCYLFCVGCRDEKKSAARYCLCCDNRPPKVKKRNRVR